MKFFSHYTLTGYCNTYIVGPDHGGDALVVDPGLFDVPFLELMESQKLYPRYILVTHAHDAHIYDIKNILKIYDASLYAFSHSLQGFPTTPIREDQAIEIGEFEVQVMETPGHSGDSVIYRWNSLLFTGDTLLAGTIGSTNDPFSKELLLASVREKLLSLKTEHYIFPGHGPPTTLNVEKRTNPDLTAKT